MNQSAIRATAPEYRTILVPLDGSELAAAALGTARALAARFGAELHVVTVVVEDTGIRRALVESAEILGTTPEDLHIHVEVDTDAAAGVQRCAANLDRCLICMASHGRGRISGTLVGSTARDVIERMHAPVVVGGPLAVNPDPADRTATRPLAVDHLVACVDGTAASEAMLPVAAAWSHSLGMKLTILTIAEPSLPPERIGAPWRRHHGPNEDADAYIERLGDRWALEAPGLDATVVYDPIGPGPGLKTYIDEHPTGLVVVGSHLRDGFEHLVFGSGAGEIVHTSTAPVLVVPVESKES